VVSSVSLNIELSRREAESAIRLALLRTRAVKIGFETAVALVAAGLLLAIIRGDDAGLVFFGGALLVYVAGVVLVLPKVRCCRKSVRGCRNYQFSSNGVHIETESATATERWPSIGDLRESRSFIYFSDGRRVCYPQPKRTLTDRDVQTLRTLAGADSVGTE
jgi:hypothetical protein